MDYLVSIKLLQVIPTGLVKEDFQDFRCSKLSAIYWDLKTFKYAWENCLPAKLVSWGKMSSQQYKDDKTIKIKKKKKKKRWQDKKSGIQMPFKSSTIW